MTKQSSYNKSQYSLRGQYVSRNKYIVFANDKMRRAEDNVNQVSRKWEIFGVVLFIFSIVGFIIGVFK